MVLTGNCLDCGAEQLHAKGRCTPCYWKARREAAKQLCPGCGLARILRPEGGCGMCVRRARPRKAPTPRICRRCGRLAEHDAHGLCSSCYQRDPGRIPTWTIGALCRLGDGAPSWFAPLAHDLTQRCAPAVAAEHLREVEQLLHQGVNDPAALIAALRPPGGRSPGAAARLVDEFFARTGIGAHLDEGPDRAARRRQRRLDRLPDNLAPAVVAFSDYLLNSRRRAELVGHGALADATIETRLADLAVLADYLTGRGVLDWSAVAVADIETFITDNTGSRLASCRAFFGFARRRKLILVDPTAGIVRRAPRGFTGRLLDLAHQRRLLRRWVRTDLDPRERLVGLLSLIHGASCAELRHLLLDDVDLHAATARLGRRPHPVPLDPLTADALRDTLTDRASSKTDNPHVLVTKDTRCHDTACSPYFMTHVLDGADITPAVLRHTRLADYAHRLDPRLVAAAFGMTEEGALHYLTDAVHDEEHAFRPHL